MYKNKKVLAVIPAYNEESKISAVVQRIPADIVDTICVVDDGSTDQTASVAEKNGAMVEKLGSCIGVGAAIRRGIEISKNRNFDIVVIMAGNNKDSPEEMPRLLDPICDQDYDLVMGSRYLKPAKEWGDMPFYRKLATRLHPMLLGFVCGKKITESTNGFRAIKVSVFNDRRINIYRKGLNQYQLEVYLLIKLFQLKYRTTEVPVSKVYPSKSLGYTKMRPVLDWWKMLSPIFWYGLKILK
jgi:dolichol-phosphate mannosyltransferase